MSSRRFFLPASSLKPPPLTLFQGNIWRSLFFVNHKWSRICRQLCPSKTADPKVFGRPLAMFRPRNGLKFRISDLGVPKTPPLSHVPRASLSRQCCLLSWNPRRQTNQFEGREWFDLRLWDSVLKIDFTRNSPENYCLRAVPTFPISVFIVLGRVHRNELLIPGEYPVASKKRNALMWG